MGENVTSVKKRIMSPNSLANLRPKWEKGFCPNPGGRKKLISDAFHEELTSLQSSAIAKKTVQKARAGSVKHLQVLLDRTEGPMSQHIEHSGTVIHERYDFTRLSSEQLAALDAIVNAAGNTGVEG